MVSRGKLFFWGGEQIELGGWKMVQGRFGPMGGQAMGAKSAAEPHPGLLAQIQVEPSRPYLLSPYSEETSGCFPGPIGQAATIVAVLSPGLGSIGWGCKSTS